MPPSSSVAIFHPTDGVQYVVEGKVAEFFGPMPADTRTLLIDVASLAIVSLKAVGELEPLLVPSKPGFRETTIAALENGIKHMGGDAEKSVADATEKFKRMLTSDKVSLLSMWVR